MVSQTFRPSPECTVAPELDRWVSNAQTRNGCLTRCTRGRSGRSRVSGACSIGLGGQPAFVELFASPTGLRRHLPGLLEAAAIHAALLSDEATPGRRARRFVGSLGGAPLGDQLGADAGAGHALASRSPHHEIRGLGWDDEVLHVTVFNRRHHLMELA
jgi:hypothetical protein